MREVYSIVAADNDNEISFLRYVQQEKIDGFVHPNTPNGMLFKLVLDEELASLLRLKFRFKVFGRAITQPE